MDLKKIIAVILALIAIMLLSVSLSSMKADTSLPNTTDWDAILNTYRNDDTVNQLIFVQYSENCSADILGYRKTEGNTWTLFADTTGYLGINGIGIRKKEGDGRTPSGDFALTAAFGIKDDPGASLPYVKITEDFYACNENNSRYYNQIINAAETGHNCKGIRLIDHSPAYNYGVVIESNPKNKYPNGSAIFLCCKGPMCYTDGSIVIDEEAMVSVIRNISDGARIVIDNK